MVVKAVKLHPDRFYGLAGLDPWEGMRGVRELEHAVKDLGFIGAHFYPHWYELAPDHAKWYPFYAKCCELDIPVQMQVGQSMIYDPDYRLRSVGGRSRSTRSPATSRNSSSSVSTLAFPGPTR